MNQTGTTIFYDSVCGIPLFIAPTGRSFNSWYKETQEHGWPSFRDSEVVQGNIFVNKTDTGFLTVYSTCGTYLGSNLPDEEGNRYCMDLSCISGRPAV